MRVRGGTNQGKQTVLHNMPCHDCARWRLREVLRFARWRVVNIHLARWLKRNGCQARWLGKPAY
jgi:hypothetical protein